MYLLFLICVAVLLAAGFVEKRNCVKNRNHIKVRINVNGIRGKSTVTRLITGVLSEAGYQTMGKTTGTSPRIGETPIIRKIEGANIKEQVKIIGLAAREGAEALVCECMAVRPEYQKVFQEQMLDANIAVIVNVKEDHLDVMGPSTDQIAQAFTTSIPYGGILIISDGPYRKYFEEIARERQTKVLVADDTSIPKGYFSKFNYLLFPENVSLALAAAKALAINKKVALRGMIKASPDPGALKMTYIPEYKTYFVNAFAANEPESTLAIWDLVRERHPEEYGNMFKQPPVILFNGRPDRIERTEQYMNGFFTRIPGAILVGIGQGIDCIEKSWKEEKLSGIGDYIHLADSSEEDILAALAPIAEGRILLGTGNIHGEAEILLEKLMPGSQADLKEQIIHSQQQQPTHWKIHAPSKL